MAGDYNTSFTVDKRRGGKELNLDWYISRVPHLAAAIKKKVGEELFKAVVSAENVPFVTGRYVSSHRIGIGAEDNSFSKNGAGSLDEARSKVLASQLPKLESIKSEDNVFLTNSVQTEKGYSYAKQVEYAGWLGTESSTMPYLVYEKALLQVKPRIRQFIKDLKGSYFGI
jgi:hypothetical protein